MAISTHLSLKPKPQFGQNEQGFYAQVTFIVRGVDWPSDTLEDIFTHLPQYGQVIEDTQLGDEWIPLKFRGLIVKDIAPTQPDLSKHNVWTAEVTFGPRGGIIEPDRQYVRWSGGTITRRIETDLRGYTIGSRNWVMAGTGMPVPVRDRRGHGASLTNEHAEIGADVHMPAMEFEIQLPLANSQWNQAFMEATTIARGRVNSLDFMFVDEWGTPFQIAPYWCLLRDTLVEPEPRSPYGHRISYRFMLAALDLPSNLTAYWNTGPLGDYVTVPDPPIPDPLPVGYGAFTTFMPYNEDDEFDFKDGEVPKARDVRVFQAHLGYDFNSLPGIIR